MTVYFLAAALILSAYIFLSPRFAQWAYKRFLFHTNRSIGDPKEFASLLERRGGRLFSFVNRRGNLLRCALAGNPQNPVLMYHFGKDGDIEKRADIIELIVSAGYQVFIYEYSGYGKSDGKPSLRQMKEDAEDAFDFLVDHLNIVNCDVTLFGESMGGLNATHVLKERCANRIILKSAFSSLAQAAWDKMPVMRIYPRCLFPDADNESILSTQKSVALIIHGAGDRMVPVKHLARLARACCGPHRTLLLPESRHSFMTDGDRDKFITALTQFRKYSGKYV